MYLLMQSQVLHKTKQVAEHRTRQRTMRFFVLLTLQFNARKHNARDHPWAGGRRTKVLLNLEKENDF